MKSIELCVSRFDSDTSASFMDLYSKVDANVITGEESAEEEKTDAF